MLSDLLRLEGFLSPTTTLSLLLTLASIAAVYIWYSYVYSPYQHFKKVGITGPVPKAFDGNLTEINKLDTLKSQKYLAEHYGPVVGYFLGISPKLQISDLDMLKEIMVKHFNTAFTNRPTINLVFRKDFHDFTPGVLDAKDDNWRKTRHILTPTFSAHKMKLMEPLIATSVERLVEKLSKLSQEGKGVEIHKMYGLYTLEVILASAFGRNKDIQNSADDRLVQAAIGTFEAVGQSTPDGPLTKWLSLFPWLSVVLNTILRNSTLANDWDYIMKSGRAIVQKRRQEGESGNFKDLLQLMLDARKDDASADQKGLSDKEIVAQCEVILLAGYETTSNALSYVSYLLALNPEVQDKLHEEIEEYYAENPNSSFYEAAQKIEYLDQVLNESLRLYPPVARTFRESSKDVDINVITIPKGTDVAIPIHYIHHNPEYWPEPEKFDPERFTAEAKANRHPMSFMPFGMGPRNCIGMRFALLEAKMALIEVLRKFRFVQTSETEVPLQLKVGITTSPKNGIILKVEPFN